jgi:hypothetical protein
MKKQLKPIRVPVLDPSSMRHSVAKPECAIPGCICHDLEREQAIANILSSASAHDEQPHLQISPRFQSMMDRLLPEE